MFGHDEFTFGFPDGRNGTIPAALLATRYTNLGQIVLKLDGGPLNGQFFGERHSDYVLTQQVH